jgi:hypothetical protein
LESFLTAIRQGHAPTVTVRDGARATIGCLKMLESARTLSYCTIDLDAALDWEEGTEASLNGHYEKVYG